MATMPPWVPRVVGLPANQNTGAGSFEPYQTWQDNAHDVLGHRDFPNAPEEFLAGGIVNPLLLQFAIEALKKVLSGEVRGQNEPPPAENVGGRIGEPPGSSAMPPPPAANPRRSLIPPDQQLQLIQRLLQTRPD